MKFCWCTLMVKDLQRSIAFYREAVGLPLERRFQAGPGVEICFLGDGETKVELICDAKCQSPAVADNVSLGFESGSTEATIARLKSLGVDVFEGPFQPNPTIRFFFVKDPDGVRVQFVEHLV